MFGAAVLHIDNDCLKFFTLLPVEVADVILVGIKGRTRHIHLTRSLQSIMKLCESVANRVILYEL